jgi:hypothetical protein
MNSIHRGTPAAMENQMTAVQQVESTTKTKTKAKTKKRGAKAGQPETEQLINYDEAVIQGKQLVKARESYLKAIDSNLKAMESNQWRLVNWLLGCNPNTVNKHWRASQKKLESKPPP